MTLLSPLRCKRAPRGSFVGLTTVDIVFDVASYPGEDSKNTARECTIAAGGPASNAAVAFSYLGGHARLTSALGRSAIADLARRDLRNYSVAHVDMAATSEKDPPLSAIVIAANSGSRTIFTSPAIDEELAIAPRVVESSDVMDESSDILLLDGHQVELAAIAARLAKDRGITVVLDGDLYQPRLISLLPLVDIVIYGKSFVVPGKSDSRQVFDYFESFGIKHVIATNGAQPVELASNGVHASIDVEKGIKAVDTLAAGDFFHGAFCYHFSVTRDMHRALSFAARVASSSVTTFGTRQWMTEHDPSAFG